METASSLRVNPPGDRYEREADAVADRVLAANPHPGPLRISRLGHGQARRPPGTALGPKRDATSWPTNSSIPSNRALQAG
ncbi:MAG: hypothetical protein P8188_07990 [Gemmatimonadota bacterium]